jgi:uncharacterized membrane protein
MRWFTMKEYVGGALWVLPSDPYTAVQAIDHLSVVCCDLAVRPLGTKIINGRGAGGMSSYQETTSPTTCSSSAGCLDATALAISP